MSESINGLPVEVVALDPTAAFDYMDRAGAKPDYLEPSKGEIRFVGTYGVVPSELADAMMDEYGQATPGVPEQVLGMALFRMQAGKIEATYTDFNGDVPSGVALGGLFKVRDRLKQLPWGQVDEVSAARDAANAAAATRPPAWQQEVDLMRGYVPAYITRG